MPRPASSEPTQRELEILQVLWEIGPAALGEVRQALCEDREIATTTVATMLGVMLDKRLVTRRKSSRGYQWSARVSRDAAASDMVGSLVDRLFDGSASRMVAHLMEEGNLSRQEMRQLRELIGQSADSSATKSSSRKPSSNKPTSRSQRNKS